LQNRALVSRSVARSIDLARAFAAVVCIATLAACDGGSTAAGTAVPSPSPAPSKAAVQPAPTGTPAPAPLIPNLTQEAALQLYLDQDFACVIAASGHAGWTRHRCTKQTGGGLAEVDLEGPGTGVADLKASTIGLPDVIVEGFLGDSASLPFDGSASDQAQQWVSDTFQSGGGATVIGGVSLQLMNNPPAAWVILKPAG
jgi:hypothetical protein